MQSLYILRMFGRSQSPRVPEALLADECLEGAGFDGPFDVIFGHADGFGVMDGVAKAQIRFRVTAAHFGGNDNCAGELAPGLTTFIVNESLFVLNPGPM